MRIDGKTIAASIFEELIQKVEALKIKSMPADRQGITPHVAIILVGDDPASASYVRQKILKAEKIGAKATLYNLESTIQNSALFELIKKLNADSNIHGIIVQRPLPKHIDSQKVNFLVDSKKDIDAFQKNSPYEMPLAAAVIEILTHIHSQIPKIDSTLIKWLLQQTIVVVGKGETGGGPTIELLKKLGATPHVIDSKTQNPHELLQKADIIISTVGRPDIVKTEYLKKGVILVGVGMYKGDDGKLHADYNEEEIQDIASFYTPVPGGVGPVNVAMLLKNLTIAAE